MKRENSFSNCEKCGSSKTNITDSRELRDRVRRRRNCLACEYRWTTYEVSNSVYLKLTESEAGSIVEKRLKDIFKNYFHSLPDNHRAKFIDELYN